MIKKKFRLKGDEIKKIFAGGYQKLKDKDWLILYQKNEIGYPRFSVAPRKEIFKKSVERNKIKRKIYAIIKEILKKEKIKPYDFLIFPQKKEKDFFLLKESFLKIFKKINV